MSMLGLLFIAAILALAVLVIIFMARKLGLIATIQKEPSSEFDSKKSQLSPLDLLGDSLTTRCVIIILIIALMIIPLNLVKGVVQERSGLYHNVQADIANTWGHRQEIKGPALLVPYTERFDVVNMITDKDGNERKVNKTVFKQRTAIVLPEQLDIKAILSGETRSRGIYESLVYTSDLEISGNFMRPDITQLSDNIDVIHWERAWFSLGISDTQAIKKVSALRWSEGSSLIDFEPGTRITDTFISGFHAPLSLRGKISSGLSKGIEPKGVEENEGGYHFSLEIHLNGSQGFYFTPVGKVTNVSISSDWPHPSFAGNVLPDQHAINQTGFTALWSIPHLARNYPQLWSIETQKFDINEFSAGVNLFESVSLYSQIIRAIKYGVLFLVLTYVTFLTFELGLARRLHIMQYGVIGLALSMFYLALLSMAEHAGFFRAYVSAAAIIISMISAYVYAAIRDIGRAIIIFVLLTGLYSLLYAMLRLEDYALLAGSGLLLVVLAVTMYLTRNISKQEAQA